MHTSKLRYFQDSDVLHLRISEEKETGSIEVSPDITAEINDNGDIIGIEIINASTFLKNAVLDSAQAVVLKRMAVTK